MLATLVSAQRVTYQDIDGDNVTVTFSKSFLTPVNVNGIFTVNSGSVNGNNTTPQRLSAITLSGIPAAAGTNITTSAVRNAAIGGNGFAALGQINGSGRDLGNVTIYGDLGRIVAGDANTSTRGLGALKVNSMWRFGTVTGANNLSTSVMGSVTSLTLLTDVHRAYIEILGGANGKLGSVTIGGSLIAGTDVTTGSYFFNGAIVATHDIGNLTIRGSIVGNPTNAALIQARGRAATSGTTDLAIGRVTINGRVEFGSNRAGFAEDNMAANADAQIGPLVVRGNWIASDLVAGAVPDAGGMFGDGNDSKMSGAGVKDVANVFSKITSIVIGGQVIGSAAAGDHYGFVAENTGSIRIGGTAIPLNAGNGNDNELLDAIFADVRLREI